AQQAAAEKAAADKKTKKSIEAAQDGSNLLPKQRERHLFHVELDKSAFSPSTGKKLSQAFVQMFGVKEFSEKELVRLGYTVKVLWNPTKYVK
ncbi:MAG: hypothetical protein HQ522_07875, partial [Bacteroidetes bacterium]|nr:hypothetical protein [Bacteroidota bacterium]